MKRSTKQLLSLLLAIVMVFGLMAPAMAARPMGGEVAETAVQTATAEKPAASRLKAYVEKAQAILAAAGTKTLLASDLEDFAKDSNGAESESVEAGTDNYFKVWFNKKKDAVNSGRSDVFGDSDTVYTKRINFGAPSVFTSGSEGSCIEFTTTASANVKIWWTSNKANRSTSIFDASGTEVWDSGDLGANNAKTISNVTLENAGKYYIGFGADGANYIFKVEVTENPETTVEELTMDAAGVGAPVVKSAVLGEDANSKPIITVTVGGTQIGEVVDGATVKKGADAIALTVKKNGTAIAAAGKTDAVQDPMVTIITWAAKTEDVTAIIPLTADTAGAGEYTFEATAIRYGATKATLAEATANTASVTFSPDLVKPVATATAGDAKVTLRWRDVDGATGYNVYQGETKLTGEPITEVTYEATGLTNGTEYTFYVEAVRGTETAKSDAVKATPEAPNTDEGVPVTYTLDVTADVTEAVAQGSLAAGSTMKLGTDKYFTVNGGAKLQIQVGQSAKTYEDNYKATARLRTGCTHNVNTTTSGTDGCWTDNNVSITTTTANAKVKIWWYGDSTGAGQEVRCVSIWDKDGNEIATTGSATAAGAATISEMTIPTAGLYYFVTPKNSCTISKIEVTETVVPVANDYTLDVTADITETIAQGGIAAGSTKKVGTENYFTINGGAKLQVQVGQSAKTYEDNYKATARLRTGCTHNVSNTEHGTDGCWLDNNVAITTSGANAKVKIWWYGDSTGAGQEVRCVSIWDKDGNEIATTGSATAAGAATISEMTIPTAGLYYFVTPKNSCTISKIVVTDTSAGGRPTAELADWDTVAGKAAVALAADNTKGTVTATVSGILVGEGAAEGKTYPVYADGITVNLYKGEAATGNAYLTESNNKAMTTASATQDVEFKPASTGKYIADVTAVRAEDSKTKTVASTAVEFTLPLAVPAIASAASNGTETGAATVSMAVAWASVAEANSYNLYYRAKGASDWGTPIVVADTGSSRTTATVTGLTAGATYEFAVEAVRKAGTINGVTVSAETTAKSATFEGTAAAKQETPWTEMVFGTSSTDLYNRVISPKTQLYKRDDAAKKDVKVDVYEADGGETVTVSKDGDYTITLKGQAPRTIAGLTGNLNTDPEGRVLLSSHEGAGKIKENEGGDGQLFYYTAIPAGTNYTLTADVEVLRWITRDTQNGVGLAAMDRVPEESWSGSASSNSGNFWNNVYLAGAVRGSFSYDVKNNVTYSNKDAGYDSATKYSYYMGPFSVTKTGIPMTANGPYNATSGPATYYERRFPLDTRLCADQRTAKFENNTNRFNLIGNYTVGPKGFNADSENGAWMKNYELTKFKISLQKNNTGYISTVWDASGKQMLGQNIEYFVKGAMDLSGDKPYHDDDLSGRKDIPELQQCLDSDFEYVGLFTSRDIDALFTNVKLSTIAAENDEPAVSPPTTKIIPTMSISSGANSNSETFTLSIAASVEGTVTIKQNGVALPDTYEVKYAEDGNTKRLDVPVTLKEGNNTFVVNFQPDPDQELPAFTELSNTTAIEKTATVKYNPNYKYLQNIYVSNNGRTNGYGTKKKPLDIYTAISVVSPGQNIVLMEGVYNLDKTISIGRGMNGTDGTVTLKLAELDENGEPKLDPETGEVITKDYEKDARIYMLADVDENGDPVKVVFNGQRKVNVLSHAANYWVFKDFEVVGSSGTGFQVAGSNNLVQNIKVHDNLSTGLQISRLSNSDRVPTRPTEDKIDGDLAITDWGDWPCDNIILNCESYRNYDNGYGGADGFGAKETCGKGNIFDGCAAYWNADDGWDLYAKTEPDKGPLGRVTIKNSITFENGYEVRKMNGGAVEYEADGYNAKMNYDANGKIVLTPAGNGNGFKMGGSHLPGAHSITNSFAFYNKVKGFDSNNGPDIKVSGCTAYNNGEENVGLGSDFSTLNYLVEKTVSFKDDNMSGDKMKDSNPTANAGKGQTSTSVYNYYQWDGTQTKGVGTVSGSITADNFVSLVWDNTAWVNGAIRDASGALDLGDFLKLKNVSNAGATQEKVDPETPAETPENVVNPPEEGPAGGNNGGGSSGGGGTIADANEKADNKEQETKPAFTANKTTDAEGNTEIVVKDANGETVADVKIPATIPASDIKFDDAIDHWAEASIDNMAALGVVNGTGNNLYGVDDNVTRGALATMLFRLANGKKGIANSFADVGDAWYTDAIGWAAAAGVVTGYSETAFGPEDSITREQMAVMLTRFAKLVGLDTNAPSSELAGFRDVSAVDSWATDGMAWCVKNGIIKGVSEDTLSPGTFATRAQTATMLDRFIALMK